MQQAAQEAANAAWYLQERRNFLTVREKHLAFLQAQIDRDQGLLNEDRRELQADCAALPAAYHLPAPLRPETPPPKPEPAPSTQNAAGAYPKSPV